MRKKILRSLIVAVVLGIGALGVCVAKDGPICIPGQPCGSVK